MTGYCKGYLVIMIRMRIQVDRCGAQASPKTLPDNHSHMRPGRAWCAHLRLIIAVKVVVAKVPGWRAPAAAAAKNPSPAKPPAETSPAPPGARAAAAAAAAQVKVKPKDRPAGKAPPEEHVRRAAALLVVHVHVGKAAATAHLVRQ